MAFGDTIAALAARVPSSPYATEEAAKQFLVLPFLSRVLGYRWDCPSSICPEYAVGAGRRVDYALLSGGVTVAYVECKRRRGSAGVRQLLGYLRAGGAPSVGVLTDGVVWDFYTAGSGGPFFQFDLLSRNPASESALAGFAKGKDIGAAVSAASGVGGIVALAGQSAEGRANLEEAAVAVVRGVVAGGRGDAEAVRAESHKSAFNIYHWPSLRGARRRLVRLDFWRNGEVRLLVYGAGGNRDLVNRVRLRAVSDIAGYAAGIRDAAFRGGV